MDRKDGDGERAPAKVMRVSLPGISPEERTVLGRTFVYPNPDLLFQEALRAAEKWRGVNTMKGANVFAGYMAVTQHLFQARMNLESALRFQNALDDFQTRSSEEQAAARELEVQAEQHMQMHFELAMRSFNLAQRNLAYVQAARLDMPR